MNLTDAGKENRPRYSCSRRECNGVVWLEAQHSNTVNDLVSEIRGIRYGIDGLLGAIGSLDGIRRALMHLASRMKESEQPPSDLDWPDRVDAVLKEYWSGY